MTVLSNVLGETRREGWDDFLVSNLNLGKSVESPTFKTFRDTYMAFAFPDNAVKEGHGDMHILHNYKFGTAIYPHIHWSSNEATPTGNVQWKIDYSIARGHAVNTEAFAAFQTITLPPASCSGQYYHVITEATSGISSSNIEVDSIVLVRIYRDTAAAEDTLTGDAFLFRVDFHVEVDNLMTAEKAAPFTKA